jgi:protein-tyrosine kinase
MSLVERALQKLQASRAAAQPPTPIVPVALPVLQQAISRPLQPVAAIEPVRVEPRRVVKIDRDALRARDLLPPLELERQIAGQYQQIKRPLVAAAAGRSPTPIPNAHRIMIASALPGEGKTFTSINLALSLAMEKDTEVVLIDADVAKPHVSRLFGLQGEKGLMDLLVDRTLHAESVILPTDVPGLSLMSAGTRNEAATEFLASERMDSVAEQIGSAGGRRIVLFDSPPLLLSTESRALIHAVGQVVLVVRAEFTARQAVMDAIAALGETKPVSLILNQAEAPPSTGYYGYGSYGDAVPQTTTSA